MWALSIKLPVLTVAMVAGAGGFFAPLIRGYMRTIAVPPDDTGIRVALKDRLNALKNPYAHLKIPEDVTFDMIANSPMLWDPVRYLETCPSSDGACAMVISNEKHGQGVRASPPPWVHATNMKTRSRRSFAGRDQRDAEGRYGVRRPSSTRRPASRDPRKEIDCAEIYVPFSLVRADVDGESPFRPHERRLEDDLRGCDRAGRRPPGQHVRRRPVDSNAIGASGMIRFAEAAMQVRGQAGEHQVDGAKKAHGPRLRGRFSVLLDVDRRRPAPLGPSHFSKEQRGAFRQQAGMRPFSIHGP